MKRILITGGAGFIGSHTSLALLEKGFDLVILDSLVNSKIDVIENIKKITSLKNKNLKNKIEFFKSDLRDKDCIYDIFKKAKSELRSIDAVIHFAGLKAVAESVEKPFKYWDVNVKGSLNLFSVMEMFECKTIVFSSSATVYGKSNKFYLSEDDAINPINPYGKTKAAIENILSDIFKGPSRNWRIANLRYFNPVGAHPSGLIGEDPIGVPNNIFPIINLVAKGKQEVLKIYGNDWETRDGTCLRDYIHVMDVANGHIKTLEYLMHFDETFINMNLGTGKATSVMELVNIFQEVNKVKLPFKIVERRKGDLSICVADNTLIKEKLAWFPEKNLAEMCKDSWNRSLFN